VESDATAPRKVTLKRKSVSELRVSGSGPRAATRTVNVEVRKRRTYVKREVVQEQIGTPDADREEARRLLEESRAKRAAEEKMIQDAADKVRLEKEEKSRQIAEEQARKEAEEKVQQEEARRRAEDEERKREEERSRKLAEEKRRREQEKSKSKTRYGRKELHVAKGAPVRRRKPSLRARPSSSRPSEHGFSRPTEPVLHEVAGPEASTVA
jgi:translation initiation factor IF-2